jgi:glutamate-ammonia-ligase adenylyltransferase
MSLLESAGNQALARLAERAPAAAEALAAAAPPLRESAATVLAASDFVLQTLVRQPAALRPLLEQGFATPVAPPALAGAAASTAADEPQFMRALRRWRACELLRIAWRDLAGWATLTDTLRDLSRAADHALRAAHDFAWQVLTARYGTPRSASGVEQRLIVVAMGKLGGGELNFSSDIDLVFLFPESGDTDGVRSISNEEFFTRLGQLLIRLLDQQTEDGFVFRVDMRLRPFGDSGPLAASGASFEDYLQIHGRDWERYAWIKARAVLAEAQYAELFRTAVRPFVYRRYLDFGVFESLRDMKALIEREVARRELNDNIKLGDGGIREIEFIVQAFQLIRGGQDRRLQTPALLRALPLLAGAKLLPATAVAELDAAYTFLRRLENRLQMRADQQTHRLPDEAPERARIAASLGLGSWTELVQQLAEHRARVASHFRAIVFARESMDVRAASAPVGADAPMNSTDAQADWMEWSRDAPAERARMRAPLQRLGYADADAVARLLKDFGDSALVQRLDETGSRRLMRLVPVLVEEAAAAPTPLAVLRRLLRILEAIGARSAYFALLLHDQRARRRLVQIAAHGDFLTDQIAAHPLLLDELIDERVFEQLPDRAALAADLQHRMAGVDEDDEEQLVERLRHFQRAAIFRLAVADLSGRMPVMQVSDRLTDVAELILERALVLAWDQLVRQLGVPMCGDGALRRAVRVCAVGYGKLGGMELGYSSDLDLVFLHDSSGERQETQGARVVDNQVFFLRFAQRLVHLLAMHSPAGRLYEVDMRLRPSGKGGMLVTSIEAFADYQRREAWTWEHQALLHARAVAGEPVLRARFEAVRAQVLQDHVRRDSLKVQVSHMRNRMRHELSRAAPGEFDLKQDPGGIADIEFLAQYWALRWAHDYPPVAYFSDTIRQLESVASADLVPQSTIDVLTRTYRTYRECIHHRALESKSAVVPATEFSSERAAVIAIWDGIME